MSRSGTVGPGLPALIREDFATHWSEFGRPGFQALLVYRLHHRALHDDGVGRRIVGAACRVAAIVVRRRFGIELDPNAVIGRRLTIAHQGSIRVGGDVTIGNDCEIMQGLRLGRRRASPVAGAGTRVGDGVRIGARAHVVGDLVIGDGARIGPNAVVTGDVPAGATALARPSRVVTT